MAQCSPRQEDSSPLQGLAHHCSDFHGSQGSQWRSPRSCLDWKAYWRWPGWAWLWWAREKKKKHSLTNISCSKVLLNRRQKLCVWNALLSKLRKNSQLDAYSFIFEVSCPISFLSSAGSMISPPINSSILVCVLLAFIRFRMQRLTEPIVSLVCDQISRSSTCRPWFGKRTTSVICFPRKALKEKKTIK